MSPQAFWGVNGFRIAPNLVDQNWSKLINIARIHSKLATSARSWPKSLQIWPNSPNIGRKHPKLSQIWPSSAKSAPRTVQDWPKPGQNTPQIGQARPTLAPNRPRWDQHRPKLDRTRPKLGRVRSNLARNVVRNLTGVRFIWPGISRQHSRAKAGGDSRTNHEHHRLDTPGGVRKSHHGASSPALPKPRRAEPPPPAGSRPPRATFPVRPQSETNSTHFFVFASTTAAARSNRSNDDARWRHLSMAARHGGARISLKDARANAQELGYGPQTTHRRPARGLR